MALPIIFVVLLLQLVTDADTIQHLNVARGNAAPSVKPENTKTVTESISIRPLTDIYVDGPPQITNITTTHATLLFTSSVPVICSVVYGPDENFGQIAQDSNMNGGAIVEHRPLLAGLMPQTTYQYRVQGTDANGVLYVGEVESFQTPAESEASATEVNIADLFDGAEIVSVSSNFGGADNDQTWGAESAIDDNPATAWSSNGDGDEAFIEVSLMEPSIISNVDVWTRFMTNGSARILQFSLTTDPRTDKSEQFGPFTLPDATRAYSFEVLSTQAVETIRLDVVASTGGNTGLVDFKVFANPTVAATTTNGSELFLPLTVR